MVKLSSKGIAVAVGALALSLTAGAGVASADPFVDTTCSYKQVMDAMNAENPSLAADFNSTPLASTTLSRFLASSPAQRQSMVQTFQSTSWGQEYWGSMSAIASSCSKY
jgi:hemophore-related protein